MTVAAGAAGVFAGLALVVTGFQFLLALGVPWGHLAMGGRWPGKFPVPLRVGAVVQGGLMVAMARVMAGAGGLLAPVGPTWLPWAVLGISTLSLVMNVATPSRPERRFWAPVALVMALSALVVTLAG